GADGATGPPGPTGAPGSGVGGFVETVKIGDINENIPFNAGAGNNQAIGALIFNGPETVISNLSVYITQDGGAVTGAFQLAVLLPLTTDTSQVIGVTAVVDSIADGLMTFRLISPVTLAAASIYHFAVYNTINGSEIGGRLTGLGTTIDAPPINFRSQNLSGFTIGDIINTSDESLQLSPWIAGF
ncbi:hypothetical protein NQZ67_14790, partial [Paenibacillus sp. SCIV0701]|nr:hypothetical protein [Paenibacillus soyae]